MTRPSSSATSAAAPSVPSSTPATGVHVPADVEAAVQPALVDGVDVDAVARAVRACAGVADLYSGRFGEIGSYLPGRRIGGVQVDDAAVTVHIRARWGYGVRDLFAQIDAVTTTLRHGRRVDVVVDDIDDDLGASSQSSVTAVTAVAAPLALEPPATTTTTPSPDSVPAAPGPTTDPAPRPAPLPESSTS